MEQTLDMKALFSLTYGMYIVNTAEGGRLNGQIANTVMQITSEPLCVATCLNKANLTTELIQKSGIFSVAVLEEDVPMTFIGQFGFKSGRDIDKFANVQYELGPTGAPLIKDWSIAAFDAKVVRTLEMPSHVLFVGEVQSALWFKEAAPLMFSITYFVLLFAILALFAALYFALRKMIRDSKNTVLVRNRRANKVAIQRFRAAERHMQAGDRQAFYKEMLHAFWGYMSDKLNIPVADLTKESIREELQRRGVTADEAQRFTDIMTRCDEAQYSPSTSVEMNEVYTEGVRLISHIESIVKR